VSPPVILKLMLKRHLRQEELDAMRDATPLFHFPWDIKLQLQA
jgi:hypothetical protein